MKTKTGTKEWAIEPLKLAQSDSAVKFFYDVMKDAEERERFETIDGFGVFPDKY